MTDWATPPPDHCDLAVVGAGIVGLAVARELARRHPERSVAVLERETEVGTHQTGHNSGVIHAGIYYLPGSLKARLCVEGAQEMREFCEQRGVAHETCGKVIVATDRSELGRLDELERRGRANGVPGLRRLDADGIRELEPHAAGIAGLHSPATGIADFGAVARALAADVGGVHCGAASRRSRSASAPSCCATPAATSRRGTRCSAPARGRTGWRSPRAPGRTRASCRSAGAYLRLVPERRHLVRSLIYPVPDPALPFLGVHLTRHTTATCSSARPRCWPGRATPTASPGAPARPGRHAALARHLADGAALVADRRRRDAPRGQPRARSCAPRARYVPELGAGDVEPAFAGVRAQALGARRPPRRRLRLLADRRALHVRNAPSPGATSALAIGRHIAEEVGRMMT